MTSRYLIFSVWLLLLDRLFDRVYSENSGPCELWMLVLHLTFVPFPHLRSYILFHVFQSIYRAMSVYQLIFTRFSSFSHVFCAGLWQFFEIGGGFPEIETGNVIFPRIFWAFTHYLFLILRFSFFPLIYAIIDFSTDLYHCEVYVFCRLLPFKKPFHLHSQHLSFGTVIFGLSLKCTFYDFTFFHISDLQSRP